MHLHYNYSSLSIRNKHYNIISKQKPDLGHGLLDQLLNADYNAILNVINREVDVISKEVRVIIKNSYRTIKKYFSSFKVVGKTPKCNTARTKRTEDDSGGTDSDPDPDCPLQHRFLPCSRLIPGGGLI